MSRKREILRRAAEVFDRLGYADATMEDIAEAVGIKREALYYYFKNKSDILIAVIKPESVSLLDGIRSVLALNVSSREKFFLALQNHLGRFNPNFLEMTLVVRDHYFIDRRPEFSELATIWRVYSQAWVDLIAEGQQRGEFVAELDAKMVAYGVLGMCNWLSRWYDPQKPMSVRDILGIFFRLTGYGLITDRDEDDNLRRLLGSATPPAPAPEPPPRRRRTRSKAE